MDIDFRQGERGVRDLRLENYSAERRVQLIKQGKAYLQTLLLPQTRRARASRYSRTAIRIASRRKHYGYFRQRRLIESVYVRCGCYSDKEPRLIRLARTRQAPARRVREAMEIAGVGKRYTALSILFRYRRNGHRLRHPAEPSLRQGGPP